MAGALGMLIAIPVAASIKVVIDFMYPPLRDEAEALIGSMVKEAENKVKNGEVLSLVDLRALPEETQLLLAYFLEQDTRRITLLKLDRDAEPLKARGWLEEVPTTIIGVREYNVLTDVWQQQKALSEGFVTEEIRHKLEGYKDRKNKQYPWTW